MVEKGLQIDSKYYIDNQLLPPLERIFGVLNISKSELMGNGKQMSLFDSIKRQDTVLEEIPLQEMTGFLCQKCGKYYPRMPLTGICECGGSVLLASSRGPAKAALVVA